MACTKEDHTCWQWLEGAFAKAGDLFIQNMSCTGWTQGCCIANLFVLAIDRTTAMAFLDDTGSVHDLELAFMDQENGDSVCKKVNNV